MDEIKTESTVTIVEEDFENDNDLSRLSESEVSEVLKVPFNEKCVFQ